jgi:hypothetical protein
MQGEVRHLKEQLALQEESRSPSIAGTDPNLPSMHPESVSLFDTLVSSIHNNVAERINLQKALFEVQDADVRTRMQLEALQDSLKVCNWSTSCMTQMLFALRLQHSFPYRVLSALLLQRKVFLLTSGCVCMTFLRTRHFSQLLTSRNSNRIKNYYNSSVFWVPVLCSSCCVMLYIASGSRLQPGVASCSIVLIAQRAFWILIWCCFSCFRVHELVYRHC